MKLMPSMKREENTMTKSLRVVTLIVLAALAATAAFAQTDAQKAFTAIKSMPGTWESKAPDGRVLQVSFKVTAGGSAVMSEILGQGPEDMITMFHLDGPQRLLMTHYCGAGNQPRMQASLSPDGKTISFNFIDATNLATPDAGHMQRMVLTLLDENHHTEEWTFLDHGKETKEVFDLRRKM
ncbi:conserved exported hypothetical protein [Candidatus Sulfotelmatobacter kueseliae]|uniref:DUF1579 domain-containing protein n=1 Tax=Candidatus Sulfotelmatobacter kueseliae TaxID=2042962 RepID=A0A2U3KPC4_9BACT|nr:conserved exported hypothetical protein [Candidatus Sulfotelmatobacter kueseliae]